GRPTATWGSSPGCSDRPRWSARTAARSTWSSTSDRRFAARSSCLPERRAPSPPPATAPQPPPLATRPPPSRRSAAPRSPSPPPRAPWRGGAAPAPRGGPRGPPPRRRPRARAGAPGPGGADPRRILVVRALRGFVDGLVSVLLAGYLTRLGFTPFEVGAIVTGTLLGSAALTVTLGLAGHGLSRRRVLLGAAALMFPTGLGFAGFTDFWPLLVVAVLGTLNPSAGDVSVFLPT